MNLIPLTFFFNDSCGNCSILDFPGTSVSLHKLSASRSAASRWAAAWSAALQSPASRSPASRSPASWSAGRLRHGRLRLGWPIRKEKPRKLAIHPRLAKSGGSPGRLKLCIPNCPQTSVSQSAGDGRGTKAAAPQKLDRVAAIDFIQKLSKSEQSSRFFSRSKFENIARHFLVNSADRPRI